MCLTFKIYKKTITPIFELHCFLCIVFKCPSDYKSKTTCLENIFCM